ncbi:hypothetical protein L227DRAFT_650792 [Lentinus tigrinus ALCF2SS1-6]|uniref:Uncharacterized protein n=1 Tax=Lentinus tigrinus ALCF2SS1-6 TaxID=1328759 RepID=A0A5C2SKJ1_9APHY|nr:hypothetical protein L227DRAFT_650792 [Lentinus tigrinus ALCF2SS1-6]
MDWWSLFRKVRKVIFAFITVISLIWAIVLSVYLSKQWNDFTIFQRSIVLSLIGVNGVTALLVYLMIIVVFRMWMELLRMIFLLAIHAGTAVPFTLYGVRFSCKIFDTQRTCKIVHISFLATAWSITGLLLGYTVYLCIMSQVPKPFPLITPNDLLTGSTSSASRKSSMSSIDSSTGLLASNSARPSSTASVPSAYSQDSVSGRTVPKRMFVANNGSGIPSQPEDALARVRRAQQVRRGQSYGAMGSPQHPRVPVPQSRFSGSTVASNRSPEPPSPWGRAVSPAQSSIMSTHSRQSSAAATIAPQRQMRNVPHAPPGPLLLNPNPFMEPLSRHGTPKTALSGLSYSSAPGNLNLGHMAAAYSPFSQPYGGYLGPYSMSAGVPPQLQPGAHPGIPQAHPYTSMPPYMASLGPHVSYSASPVGGPPRMHNATPSNASIHSMAPSVHFTNEYGHSVHGHGHTTGTASDNTNMRLPPNAHMRMTSDPVWRPYSAGARLGNGPYDNVELPNPYNRGAEIRRYASNPHVRSGSHGGYEYAYAYGSQGGRVHEGGIARGFAAVNDPRWREMVMRAAATP